ncbi:MarR family winged helix-turn-helix transcriptional regulator [Microbacterium allomyrinae]|uniref:MarR family transcriptional regulator n=1 Tax=Microbacterium allomyrinae TaxID=2830666 RepID=A0A9X1LW79_9MICO|nr:MarR family transcriptional regulator [Microbacterium allomyrinae]MCC2033235.1 MarR family transcriptional regulator [Microbacterium allomyrinae]
MSDDASRTDPAFRTLAELVIDIAREIQLRAAQTTPVVPLTQTQGQVMRFVHNHPGCSASDIADGAGLQRANVSAALRDLRGRGYITSRRDDLDGRAIRIEATGLADETIGTLSASWAALLESGWHTAAGSAAIPASALETLARIRTGLHADRATKAFVTESPAQGGDRADSIEAASAVPAVATNDSN